MRKRILLFALVAVGVTVTGAGAASKPQNAAFFLSQASQGIQAVKTQWWNTKANWYNDTLDGQPPTTPLARLWSAYPLFETFVGLATAQPTKANVSALTAFANKAATLYWNPNPKPVGGYEYYPGVHWQGANIYYDDSGWWGLSFVDAYKVTGNPAYLTDAGRALRFIVASGWDSKRGGVWWDTYHHHKTIEPLAAAVLIGTRLYEAQHRDTWALNWALKLLAWANANSFDQSTGLYQRNATDKTVMDYVQGVLIEANWELCKTLHKPAMCTKAQQLANAAYTTFPRDLNWTPEYDVVYLRWMLEYGNRSGDSRWLELASYNARRAANAVGANGLYLNRWSGLPYANSLGAESANLELFAWVAAFSS